MGVWTELIGTRRGLHLRRKWWHHAAIGAAIVSSLVVYLVVSTIVLSSPPAMTTANTNSLTLLHFSLGRPGMTTMLDDLDGLTGVKGAFAPNGDLVITKRAPAPETIVCQNPPRYKANQRFTKDGVAFQSIADRADQDAHELRHCAATAAYATTTADNVLIFLPNSTLVNSQVNKGMFIGIVAVICWLGAFWTVYYRGVIPIYARRREARRKLRYEQHYAR